MNRIVQRIASMNKIAEFEIFDGHKPIEKVCEEFKQKLGLSDDEYDDIYNDGISYKNEVLTSYDDAKEWLRDQVNVLGFVKYEDNDSIKWLGYYNK